jgi:hypothetical protein
MDAMTFWSVRDDLYERPSSDTVYYCLGCSWELNVGHQLGCPVAWFEESFWRPEYRRAARSAK